MNRSTIIAVTTFVLLGVAYFATREPQVSVGVHKLTLSPVNAETLSTIELGGPTPLTLSKDNGSWFVSSAGKKYVADEGSAKALADALANLKAPDFVTARAEKHAELEVDSAKGFTVKTAGRDLVLGKSSKNGGNYVRVQGSDEVYVTNGGIGLQARRPLTDWRKKSIATFKTDELVKLTLPDLSISNEGGVWKPTSELPKDFRFDVNVAQRFAGTVTNLNAQDFSEGETDEALGLAAPLLITVESKDGRKLTLRLGEKKPDVLAAELGGRAGGALARELPRSARDGVRHRQSAEADLHRSREEDGGDEGRRQLEARRAEDRARWCRRRSRPGARGVEPVEHATRAQARSG
jgi:hypothetical protein